VEGGVHLAVIAAGKDNVQAPEAYIGSERRIGVRVSETGVRDMSYVLSLSVSAGM
jgi:hypothetical protein